MEKSGRFDQAPPPLRPSLEARPIEHEGKSMMLIQDKDAPGAPAFVLSQAALFLASLFDGARSMDQVRALFNKETGLDVPPSDAHLLLQQLMEGGLLDTPEHRAARERDIRAYLAGSSRPAVHAGGGYPTDRLELTTFLNDFFTASKGPGGSKPLRPTQEASAVTLLAPHIDFHRGGPAYAWAYGALADHPKPDVIVGLGVAHDSPNSPWVMTRKTYETPFGGMTVDASLFDDIQKCLWYDATEEEIVHRREHSLEFQAVWLKYLWGAEAPPWVPILVSTFERFSRDQAPSKTATVEAALTRVGDVLRQRVAAGQRILIVGGVDFAHVGPRFGDAVDLDDEMLSKIEAKDRASFEPMTRLEADPFYLLGVGEHAWRKVCGLSATYTALRWTQAIAPAVRGRVLTYGQEPDPAGGVVSFVSALFSTAH